MPDPVATPGGSTTLGDIIMSVRAQIPDPVTTAAEDGSAFTLTTLTRWVTDAMRVMATTGPIIQDWHAIQSRQGMDIYELPSRILSVEQLWYDLEPCARSAAADAFFRTKVQAPSYFFGPYAIHATPRLHVWPTGDRTGATTTLSGAISDTATTLTLASATSFMAYGYLKVEDEIILYRTITGATVTNVLRGQAGTLAVTHSDASPVTELNIFFKCSRLPQPVSGVNDPIEIPLGLVPLIELYVLSKVRETEQDHQTSLLLRKEWDDAITKLSASAQLKGLRQGLQVRTSPSGPMLAGGRVVVP